LAIAAPMPFEAPVTTATLPFNSLIEVLLMRAEPAEKYNLQDESQDQSAGPHHNRQPRPAERWESRRRLGPGTTALLPRCPSSRGLLGRATNHGGTVAA
jgi:hypothetical protein